MSSFSDFEAAVFGSRSSGGAEPGSGGTGGSSAYTGGTKLNIPGVAGKLGFSTGIAMLDAALGLPVSKAFGAAGNKAIESAINASRSKAVTSGVFLGALPFAGNNAGPAAAPSGQTGGQSNTPGMTGTGTQEQSTLGKTLEEAKKDYDDAVAEYEARGKQLNKLLASMGDYAGYGKDLDLAKTTAADAKVKLEEAAEAYKAAGGNVDIDVNQRIGKTIIGGGEGTLSDLLGSAGTAYEGAVRGSKAQIERDLADMQKQAEKAQKNYDETLSKYGGDVNNVNVKAAARALAEIKSNQELYQGMLDNKSLENTTAAIYGKSDEWGEKSARNIAEAKEGLGKTGQFLVDTGAAGVQLLGDIALGKATGLGMMPVMGIRSFGGGANEARQAGATYEQQFAYGGATAAIEMLTEKLADGLAGAAGKGAADDVAKEIIRKWAKTDAGRTALRAVYGVAGEAAEEAISDLVNPLARAIYDKGDSAKESYLTKEGRKDLYQEMLHDALVGGALGGLGSIGSIATGQNAAELVDMRMRDASMGDVQSQTNNAFDVLLGRMTPEQSQAREAAALARLGINEQAAQAPAAPEAPAPAAPVQNGQDALLEAAGIQPAVEQAPAPAPVVEQAEQAAAQARSTKPMSMEDYANNESPVWNNLDYDDVDGQNQIMQDARERMINEGRVVEIPESTQNEIAESFPDLRGMKKKERNHILWEKRTALKTSLRNFLRKIGTNSFEFEVNGNTIDAKLYETGIKEVLKELSQEKANMLSHSDAIFKNAEYMYSLPDYDGDPNVYRWNYFYSPVKIGDDVINVRIAIRDLANPAESQIYNWGIKKDATLGGEGRLPDGSIPDGASSVASNVEGIPSTDTVPQPAPVVNGENGGQTTGPFSAPEGLNTKSTEREGAFSSNTLNQAEAAAGVPDEARSRFTYETKSEGESVAEAASRLETDRSGEVQRLVEAEAWSGTQTDMAAQIANELYEAGDLQAYADWKKIMNDHAIETGRGTQAWAKYSRKDGQSAFEAVTDSVNEAEDISPEQKAQILQNAKEAADSYDAVIKDVAEAKAAARESGEKAKAPDSLLQLIRDISGKRNTGTIFEGNLNKLLDAQKGNVDYLTDLAYNQIIAMSNDYTVKRTFAEKVKTFQTLAQLTSVATFGRNILGNVSFGAVDTLTKDGFGVALDAAISKLTGKRTVALDKSWFSGKARKGAVDAMQKSALEIALDVDMSDGKTNKYGQSAGRTFKAANGGVDAFFSRWEQLLNYSLTTSDKFSRGALEAENRRGLDALENSNLTEEEKAAIAEQEADYRLFQNKGSAYKLSKGAHDVLNVIGFGGKMEGVGRNGGFGLGDIVNTYPGVPANLGVKALEYSPANIVKGGIELMNVLSDAKNGELDATKQYQAVMDISRGLAGVPIIALFSSIVKAGLLKNWDDEEDKDVKAQNAAEGKSGIQLNVDAIKRWLNGEQAEWKNGDHLESVGFLEPINAFMAIGSLVASQEDDATLADYAKSYANGTIQSFLDIPVMSNISNMVDTYRYSSGEGEAEKIVEAALNYAGNSVSGFIPSPIRSAAKAGDKYYRDTSGENVIESTINSLKSSIPGLRETLPVKLDNYGNPKEYYGSTADRIFDAFVNPGSRNELRQSKESAFAMGLQSETGISGVVPSRKAPNKLTIGDEKVELTPDEKRLYQETAGSQAEKYIGEMMQDELFKSLSPEEQASVIKELNATARQQAVDAIKAGRNAEGEASDYQKLIEGVNNPGEPNDIPGLDEKNVGQYVLFDTAFKGALKRGDYSRVDKLVEDLTSLDGNTQEVLAAKSKNGGDSTLNHLAEVAGLGVGAESYFKYKEGQKEAQEILDKTTNTGGDVKMLALANADIPEEEKVALLGSEAVDISKNRKSAYDVLSDYGYTVKDVYDFFEDADWSYNTKTGEYEPNNKLEPLEVASAIRNMGLSRSDSSALFDAFSAAFITSGNPNYDKWVDKRGKPWSYDSEIRYLDRTGYQYTKTNVPNYLADAAGLTNGNVAYDPESILAALLG